MNVKTAYAFATEVAWQGHVSNDGIIRVADKLGISHTEAGEVIAAAVHMGMLERVPRIGGYVAGKATNEQVFGRKFAEWMSA